MLNVIKQLMNMGNKAIFFMNIFTVRPIQLLLFWRCLKMWTLIIKEFYRLVFLHHI